VTEIGTAWRKIAAHGAVFRHARRDSRSREAKSEASAAFLFTLPVVLAGRYCLKPHWSLNSPESIETQWSTSGLVKRGGHLTLQFLEKHHIFLQVRQTAQLEPEKDATQICFECRMDIKFPGLQDRVLSKRNDAHIYVDKKKCSPFQKWQSVFVSSRIRRRFSVEGPRLSCHRGHFFAPGEAWHPRGATGKGGATNFLCRSARRLQTHLYIRTRYFRMISRRPEAL